MNTLYRESDEQRALTPVEREVVGREDYRSPYRRDYARLIHSPSFRRLQGKTQVFPSDETDFFRNRLTHSLEVAQIAKSIAIRLNHTDPYFEKRPIDVDLVELAGLAHDLGHPPFGHNGERALDDCMKRYGGFEGNAQTFHILTKAEKKDLMKGSRQPIGLNGSDMRLGLNWCFRSLASIIKYDRLIPTRRRRHESLRKGIYTSDKEIFLKVKEAVCVNHATDGKFKTIECSIMDLADDIAYSTYDLEDIFKANFLTPIEILGSDEKLLEKVAKKVEKALGKTFNSNDVIQTLVEVFDWSDENDKNDQDEWGEVWDISQVVRSAMGAKQLASSGYMRTQFTADLVSEILSGVKVAVDRQNPMISDVWLQQDRKRKVEVLKHFTFESTIMSSRVRVAEKRGYAVVKNIFNELCSEDGHMLLPDDFRELYDRCKGEQAKKRVICDFVAGMTDRYCAEFYGRMFSENPQSIFKPF